MRQHLGQHFLTNKEILQKIADLCFEIPSDAIVEIGPGHGELTDFLIKNISDNHKKMDLVLLERDPLFAEDLKEKFQDLKFVKITCGNAIDALPEISREHKGDYVLAGNIPYYLTGFLLRNISELEYKPARAVFTIQKEVAERIVSLPPRMNKLSASTGYWAKPKITGLISRKDFSPPPEVDSATIVLDSKDVFHSVSFYSAVTALFKQPRKTILNNISEASGLLKQDIFDKLIEMGLDPELRSQNLSIEEIAAIGEAFFHS